MKQPPDGRGTSLALAALLLLSSLVGLTGHLSGSGANSPDPFKTAGMPHPASTAANQTIAQPALKRDVYVFLVQFLDRGNTTPPSEILARLDAVNAYFAEVSHGAWTFNWILFYPTLGQPWYTVNETYAQGGANSDLTPLADVIMQAYDSGVRFPTPGTYPLVPSALIIHAGNDGAMTGNATDIRSVTTGPYCSGLRTNPPNEFCLLTAIVAETSPTGVVAHELTHQFQRFDEVGNPLAITLGHSNGAVLPGMVPVDWWDPMYQGLRNPNGTGTEPAEYMAWTRMSIGFLPPSQIAVVERGQSATVTLQDLEDPTSGYQAIRIPIENTSLYHRYYFVELRKGDSYDAYFPWLTTIYPNRIGMLIYWVNVSKYAEPFQIFLVKPHTIDVTAQEALFGPCSSPCVSAMSMLDATNGVNITIESTSDSAFVVRVGNSLGPTTSSRCPSLECFLGAVNLGYWGLVLNTVLIVGASLCVIALAARRRRGSRTPSLHEPSPRRSP